MRKSPENYSLLDRFFVALTISTWITILSILDTIVILDYYYIVLFELHNNEVFNKVPKSPIDQFL